MNCFGIKINGFEIKIEINIKGFEIKIEIEINGFEIKINGFEVQTVRAWIGKA